jgi:hypothetical protein
MQRPEQSYFDVAFARRVAKDSGVAFETFRGLSST